MASPPSEPGGAALPLVSIITPSYNHAPFLIDTLRSVAEQDYPRIEHIVMDGGSTDGSVEILRQWSHEHSIEWHSEPDDGQADAISRGIARSTGSIVAWLNSDDIYLDSGVISEVVEQFRRGARFVTGAGWYLNPDGSRQEFIPVFPDRIRYEVLRHVDWILQPATFVERELFLSVPMDITLHFAFDWDLFVRLSRLVEPKPVFREIAGYRRHEEGKTVAGGTRRQLELLDVTRRHNGILSPSFLVLAPVVAVHKFADRLPWPIKWRALRLMYHFAVLTQRLTNGRGIQY